VEIINKSKKYFFYILFAIFLFLVVFFTYNSNFYKKTSNQNFSEINYIKIRENIVKVDLALTSKEQERGLSGRNELKNGEGMLFIFNKPAKYSFWMKEMNFPIDIIWIDEGFSVIYIKKNAEPLSYPEIFYPSLDAKYVLEVPALFSEKNNLEIGDFVKFLP